MGLCDRRALGQMAESDACTFLEAKGFRLLMKNYHCYHGEIDLIMQDQDYVVFVEVRSRRHIAFGNALESVTPAKIKKLIKTATHFLQHKKWLHTVNSRFDIVAIHPIAGKMRLEWIKNAFGA